MKQRIRINENQLKQIVTESVKRLLKENQDYTRYKGMFEQAYNAIGVAYRNMTKFISREESLDLCNSDIELEYLVGSAMEALKDTYQRFGSLIKEIEEPSSQVNEPENWHERNEHGDFDDF